MAGRKPKAEATIETPEGSGILHDEMYDARSLNPALETIYDEMGITDGGDATVHISKLDADMRGNEANVWRGDPDSYDLEQIAKTFGSGAYRVKIYVRTPEGRKPCMANKIFFWKLSPADERKVKEAAEAPITAPAVQPANEIKEMLAGIAAMMQENTRQLIEATRPRETNPMNTLDGIKQLAEIMRPAAAPAMDIMTTLTVATKLIDLSKGMNPPPLLNSDGEVSSGAVLMKALEVFGETVAKAKTAQPALPDQPAQLAQPAPETQEFPGVTQQELDEMSIMFKMQLKMANAKADNGADPEEIAVDVWDYAPDNVIDALLHDPHWFSKLCEMEPGCAKHQAWYESVRGHLMRFEAEDAAAESANLTKEKTASMIDGKGNAEDATGTSATIKPASTT